MYPSISLEDGLTAIQWFMEQPVYLLSCKGYISCTHSLYRKTTTSSVTVGVMRSYRRSVWQWVHPFQWPKPRSESSWFGWKHLLSRSFVLISFCTRVFRWVFKWLLKTAVQIRIASICKHSWISFSSQCAFFSICCFGRFAGSTMVSDMLLFFFAISSEDQVCLNTGHDRMLGGVALAVLSGLGRR